MALNGASSKTFDIKNDDFRIFVLPTAEICRMKCEKGFERRDLTKFVNLISKR
jgi:hypothetical protein